MAAVLTHPSHMHASIYRYRYCNIVLAVLQIIRYVACIIMSMGRACSIMSMGRELPRSQQMRPRTTYSILHTRIRPSMSFERRECQQGPRWSEVVDQTLLIFFRSRHTFVVHLHSFPLLCLSLQDHLVWTAKAFHIR